MAGTQPHDHLIPSTEAGDSGYPAQNTRSKTPANAARAAPPKAPGAGKGRTTRAAIELEEADNTPEDDAVPNSQPGIPLPKRSRTLTASREAQEIEDRARLMAARLTLARVEKETAAFYETGENPGIGTFSPKIVSIGARVGVRLELVSDIALKRFQAINIVRLCASTRVDYREDDTAVPKLVGNTMHFTSANAKITDYKNDVSRWNEGFANYMAVWGLLFGATHPETVTAMAVFHAYIIRQQAAFTAAACIDYAITRMTHILAARGEDPELWYEIPAGTTSLFFTVTTSKGTRPASGGATTKKGAPNDSTVTCLNFNKSGCARPSCRRPHECSKCGNKSHGEKDCKS